MLRSEIKEEAKLGDIRRAACRTGLGPRASLNLKKTPRHNAAFFRGRPCRPASDQRSIVSATPMPPPMHREAMPFLAF